MLFPRKPNQSHNKIRTIRNPPDQSINLGALHTVQRLQSLLNLSLIGLDIANENQRIVLFDLLHCAFRVQGVDDDLMVIETLHMGDGLAGIFGCAGELEGLWVVE